MENQILEKHEETGILLYYFSLSNDIKGTVIGHWVISDDCSFLEKYFRIYLRPFRHFYDAYFFSKSAKSIFKILIDCSLWRDEN